MWSDRSMSTIDPDAARRERDARERTPSSLILPGVLLLVLPAALAWGIGQTIAGSLTDTESGFFLYLALIIVGSVGSVLSLTAWVNRSSRNPRLLGAGAAVGIGLIGAGAGLMLSDRTPGWIGEPRSDVVAFVLAVIGVLLLAVSLWVRVLRSGRLDVEEQIIRTSTPVAGVVTNQGYTQFGESSRLLTEVTYAFDDASGTRRYVKRPTTIDAADPIVEGEMVDVWYDRLDPSDLRRIVVRRRDRGPSRL